MARYRGDYKVVSFTCLDQLLCLAFAQLTYRESLRDIEACLRAFETKLYHMGFRGNIARNTLAHASEHRDWRIYADLAQVLIRQARPLYTGEDFGVQLNQTVYAFDSTTIDPVDPSTALRSDQTIILNGVTAAADYPAAAPHLLLRCREQKQAHLPDQQLLASRPDHCPTLQRSLVGGTILPMDQAAPSHQGLLWYLGERSQNSSLDRHLGLRTGSDSQKTTRLGPRHYTILQILSLTLLEKTPILHVFSRLTPELLADSSGMQLGLLPYNGTLVTVFTVSPNHKAFGVPYIGFIAGTRKHCDARNVTNT